MVCTISESNQHESMDVSILYVVHDVCILISNAIVAYFEFFFYFRLRFDVVDACHVATSGMKIKCNPTPIGFEFIDMDNIAYVDEI